jgi:hypothetical protein
MGKDLRACKGLDCFRGFIKRPLLFATDIGVGIVGQHIDVFTGTGTTAEQETFRITSNDNRVCFTSSPSR